MKAAPNMLLGALMADSLALGPHWIYDTAEIRRKLGRVSDYRAPLAIYHAGKTAGDLTHYGDQTLILLRSIAALKRFDLDHFAGDWQAFWESPDCASYRDGATRSTLAQLQAGVAAAATTSNSHDIAGAARIAPLFLLPWHDDAALLAAVKAQTAFTHSDPSVVETAEFFARLAIAIAAGAPIDQALHQTAQLPTWQHLPLKSIALAVESAAAAETDAQALHRHGLACSVADAFPGICHLLLRYPQDPVTALIENANAGGDSAARGMILGMIYGAAFPATIWPAAWREELQAYSEIERLIAALA
jgi:ADP-ribosylglycohydrolase